MNTTHASVSVPLRQCLVMSVLYGDSHQLPDSLFASKSKDEGDTFDLDNVKGPVKLKKAVELEPFKQKEIWGYTKVRGHSKRVVVCTESEDFLMKGQVMCVLTPIHSCYPTILESG